MKSYLSINNINYIKMVKCQFKDCTVKNALFGFENDKPKFCSKHKEDGMILLCIRACIKCHLKESSYGFEGGKRTHCKDCKEENMINVVSPKCVKCKDKQPSFGFEGQEKATHCGDCKELDMINIVSHKCVKCNNKLPSFGLEGQEKATHCGDCKEENMVNIKDKKCIKCNIKIPCFGLEGEKPTHCNDCKEENMINVKHQKCIKCKDKRPSFGFERGNPTHCRNCKEENMIDVVSPKCFCGKKGPSFGLEGTKATHCGDCKEPNMINVVSPRCFCGKKIPYYGYEGKKPSHCNECKEPYMINVVSPRCKTEFCDTQVTNKAYEGYCAYCFGNLYPNSPVIRNFKTKERLVVDYIKEYFKDYDWIFDKTINDGCSNRRPDIYLDLGYQILIIEVDENQHRYVENICENKRMMILSQDVNHRPIVFIRFNPDKYINEENKLVPSCFSIVETTGALKVNSKTKWMHRLEILKDNIDYWIEKETNKTIKLVQLFYDEV
jgi:hypothetical protein